MLIKRNLLPLLQKHLPQPEITLLTGPRQSGKTTLLHLLREQLAGEGKLTLFFNLDIEKDAEFFESQEKLIRRIRAAVGEQRAYVFIDEIQRKENASLFLKGLYDSRLPYKFIVSGSGSLELKEKIKESLVGRKRIFELGPVDIEEFIAYRTGYQYEERLGDWVRLAPAELEQLLLEYLNFGGYPRVILEDNYDEKTAVLEEILGSYLDRDIRILLQLEKSQAFSLMLRLVAGRIGTVTNYSGLASETALAQQTLKKYLWYAEKTFVLRPVTPFFRNPMKELVKAPEYYFVDLGMRNHSLRRAGTFRHLPEMGAVFENFVFHLLHNRHATVVNPVKYWRTKDKAEVDFIVEKGLRPLPVEAKCQTLKKPTISRSMRSFINAYTPEEAWVVNLSFRHEVSAGDTRVRFRPWHDLVWGEKGSL